MKVVNGMSVIGLDIGTSSAKGILLSNRGQVIGKSYRGYAVSSKSKSHFELTPNQVWEAIVSILNELSSLDNKRNIKAISISAMGDTVTPFDHQLVPLHNSLLAFDTRSARETTFLSEKLGEKWVFKTTGMPIHSTYSACKILWLKNHYPRIFDKTVKFLCYEDFIASRLGADYTISYSSAARTLFFDLHQKSWNEKILNLCSVREDQLSRPCPSGISIGHLSKKVAKETALSEKTQIICGGHDQPCGAIGMGVVSEGSALDTTGTIEVILVPFSQPHLNETMFNAKICCYNHCYPNTYCSFSQVLTAGAAYQWFKDNFFQTNNDQTKDSQENVYQVIEANMPSHPKNLYFIPYLSGSGNPTMNPNAKGVFYGLTLATNKNDIARSVLEGITYEMRINLELMESISGTTIHKMKSVGGASRSNFWLQLKADITGKTILSSKNVEAGCLGAAILSGIGVGIFTNFEEGIDAVNRNLEYQEFSPNREMNKVYNEKYHEYKTLNKTISQLFSFI